MESTLSELDKPLVLTEKLRAELQKVHGELLEPWEVKALRGPFITVGDVVTHTLIEMGVDIKLAIVDYKTLRGDVDFQDVRGFGKSVVRVKNPPGTITPELWRAVRDAMEMDGVKIEVDGEEDLAVIPVVYFAPIGANVIYGMPNTGLALIKVTEDDKRKAIAIVKEMEV